MPCVRGKAHESGHAVYWRVKCELTNRAVPATETLRCSLTAICCGLRRATIIDRRRSFSWGVQCQNGSRPSHSAFAISPAPTNRCLPRPGGFVRGRPLDPPGPVQLDKGPSLARALVWRFLSTSPSRHKVRTSLRSNCSLICPRRHLDQTANSPAASRLAQAKTPQCTGIVPLAPLTRRDSAGSVCANHARDREN